MTGKLYVVATPIGNLEDITLRAIETLKNCDLIAAEDTRRSRKLLNHYQIKTRLTSYHDYTASRDIEGLLALLEDGAKISLISDAGTPLISDPGYQLVRACIDNKIQVSSVPGPTALITALAVSGLPPDTFYFGEVPFYSARIPRNRMCLAAGRKLLER